MLLLVHLLVSQNVIIRLRMFLFELSVMLHITNAIFLIFYILLHVHFVYFNIHTYNMDSILIYVHVTWTIRLT